MVHWSCPFCLAEVEGCPRHDVDQPCFRFDVRRVEQGDDDAQLGLSLTFAPEG
jgi:hypothetical protein